MKERDCTNSFTSLDECPKANEIIAFIKGFLYGAPDGVVFLYEIPYCKFGKERTLYRNFCNSFPDKQYKISSPGKKADSCTLAIWKNKETSWDSENCVNLLPQKLYANKYIELKSHNLRLMGIHAPLDGPCPFDFLKELKKYSEGPEVQKVIILGDFNIVTNEWRAKELTEQMEKGKDQKECEDFFNRRDWLLGTMPGIDFSDAIDGETPTYKKGEQKGKTVDHVLISDKLKGKVVAQVIPQEILELSDHAVIIVDIRE